MDADRLFGDGTWFSKIGDYTRERYLDFPYARGTRGEVAFLKRVLHAPREARVLDIACGLGRHAIPLAREAGWTICGADISRGLIEIAQMRALREGADAHFVHADARHIPWRRCFDAAYSVCEGAFGLLGSDREHARFLASVHGALKPGARFVLSTMNAFHFAAHDDAFDPVSSVCVDETRVRGADGSTRTFNVPTRAFTPRETATLLAQAGFEVLHVFGGTTGDYSETPLQWSDPEALFVTRAVPSERTSINAP